MLLCCAVHVCIFVVHPEGELIQIKMLCLSSRVVYVNLSGVTYRWLAAATVATALEACVS